VQAKSLLEHMHQQRSPGGPQLTGTGITPKKLPFDTISLRDLVSRAGDVTRLLTEIMREEEEKPEANPTAQSYHWRLPCRYSSAEPS